MRAPEVLRSGNHNRIAEWRRRKTIEVTLARRPSLLTNAIFSEKDFQTLLEVLNGRNS
jgi:tRNA (guanine37-N1)-methyltransferase